MLSDILLNCVAVWTDCGPSQEVENDIITVNGANTLVVRQQEVALTEEEQEERLLHLGGGLDDRTERGGTVVPEGGDDDNPTPDHVCGEREEDLVPEHPWLHHPLPPILHSSHLGVPRPDDVAFTEGGVYTLHNLVTQLAVILGKLRAVAGVGELVQQGVHQTVAVRRGGGLGGGELEPELSQPELQKLLRLVQLQLPPGHPEPGQDLWFGAGVVHAASFLV